jgi:hypothetical protein
MSVRLTRRVVRFSRRTPSAFSSAWTWSLTVRLRQVQAAARSREADRRDIAPEALRHLLTLRFGQSGPGRADRQPGHRWDIEGPENDRLELRKTPALPECAAVLHRAEQRIVKPLHGVTPARRRGLEPCALSRGCRRVWCTEVCSRRAQTLQQLI